MISKLCFSLVFQVEPTFLSLAMAVIFVISAQNSNYQHCFTHRHIFVVNALPQHFKKCLNNRLIINMLGTEVDLSLTQSRKINL